MSRKHSREFHKPALFSGRETPAPPVLYPEYQDISSQSVEITTGPGMTTKVIYNTSQHQLQMPMSKNYIYFTTKIFRVKIEGHIYKRNADLL